MMNCSNCHRTVPDDAILCPYCGYEQQIETLSVCSSCNRTIPDDAILCPYCGQPVERQSSQLAEPLTLTSPRFLQIQAILFFIWCIICVCCSMSAFFLGNRDLLTVPSVSPFEFTQQIDTPMSTKYPLSPPTTTLESLGESCNNPIPPGVQFAGSIIFEAGRAETNLRLVYEPLWE